MRSSAIAVRARSAIVPNQPAASDSSSAPTRGELAAPTTCASIAASRCARASMPLESETDWMRASGTTLSWRHTAPVRSRSAPDAIAMPLRRRENQRTSRARGGDTVNPPASPDPVIPARIDSVSSARSGSTSPSTRRTSSRSPTGSRLVLARLPDESIDCVVAREIVIAHHPNGRQSSG